MENRNNGWIHKNNRLPKAEDGDADGKVLVWHAYQGVMLTDWLACSKNPFCVYWMRTRDGIGQWTKATDRLPVEDDTDAQNCVLVKDRYGSISVTGWHQFNWNSTLTHWQRLPAPPGDYRELRKMQ